MDRYIILVVIGSLLLLVMEVSAADKAHSTVGASVLKVDNGAGIEISPSERRQIRQCVGKAVKIRNKSERKSAVVDCLDAYLPTSKKSKDNAQIK